MIIPFSMFIPGDLPVFSCCIEAGMPKMAFQPGVRLVIINKGETPLDRLVHLRFEERIGEVMPPAVDRLNELIEGDGELVA